MNTLKICLFGGFHVIHSGQVLTHKITRNVQQLLAYLLVFRQRCHHRNLLAGTFWSDACEEKAHSCLRTTLWRLRRVLEPPGTPKGTYLMTTLTGEVGFNTDSDFWLDAATFENIVVGVLQKPLEKWTPEDAHTLEKCQRLYIGEMLEGFYDDWAIRERERMRSLMLKSLIRLMDFSKSRGDAETGLNCGELILRYDPLREEIHREMMHLYLACGQPALALRQYNDCCRSLNEELGISPMEETRLLCDRIAGVNKLEFQDRVAFKDRTMLRVALQKMRLALEEFDQTQKKIQRAVRLLQEVLGDPP